MGKDMNIMNDLSQAEFKYCTKSKSMSKYEYLIDEACFNTTAENADLKI